MTKKLTRHGNSLALVIDKPILELLNIDEKTPLSITTDGQCLVVSRAANDARRCKKFEAARKKVNAEWGDVLCKLAK